MAILGNKRKCYIAQDSSVTWLVGEQTNSFDLNANLVEVSDKSDEWQKFISGIKGATASVTVFADKDSEQQQEAIDSLMTGTELFVVIGEGATTAGGWKFKALVGSLSETNDNGSVSTRTINLTATGAVEMLD